MKVLWLTNSASLAARRLGSNPNLGGWISSLEEQILQIDEIELGVAFPYGYAEEKSFSIDRTLYYTFPLPRDKGKIFGMSKRWRHNILAEDGTSFLLKIIEDFKPDLIHIFGSERSYISIISQCHIPIILQIQGNLNICVAKWFSGISWMQVLKYSNLKNLILGYSIFHSYYLMRNRAIREQRGLLHCKYIIGRTDWDRRISSIMAPESTYFHCEELLREEFYNTHWHFPDRNKVIFFSILSPNTYKGLEIVLQTANLLKAMKKIDFEWLVAGVNGTEEIVKIIEKSKSKKYKDNCVYFKGSLNVHELISWLIKSNMYVHPSHIENSPNSVCEAMILGVPVIATYAGGTPSIVRDGVEGILVQDGDPYALTGAIMELLGAPERMQLFSSNSRERALIRHDPQTVVAEVVNIYKKVLNC